jgi:hypothetical protein
VHEEEWGRAAGPVMGPQSMALVENSNAFSIFQTFSIKAN